MRQWKSTLRWDTGYLGQAFPCHLGAGAGGRGLLYRFMTSHPIAKLLLCSGAKHQDGRPMPFGFFVILIYRLTELCILNAENVEKVYGLLFKQTS